MRSLKLSLSTSSEHRCLPFSFLPLLGIHFHFCHHSFAQRIAIDLKQTLFYRLHLSHPSFHKQKTSSSIVQKPTSAYDAGDCHHHGPDNFTRIYDVSDEAADATLQNTRLQQAPRRTTSTATGPGPPPTRSANTSKKHSNALSYDEKSRSTLPSASKAEPTPNGFEKLDGHLDPPCKESSEARGGAVMRAGGPTITIFL